MRETQAGYYLHDLGVLLVERALAAKELANDSERNDRSFQTGRLRQFHEFLTLMLLHAKPLGLQLEDLGLDGYEFDQEPPNVNRLDE